MRWVVLLLLCGCATPYTPPSLTRACVNVRWSSPDEIKAACGVGNAGCWKLVEATIYTEKPDSFDDPKVHILGHELMHALGARHE